MGGEVGLCDDAMASALRVGFREMLLTSLEGGLTVASVVVGLSVVAHRSRLSARVHHS